MSLIKKVFICAALAIVVPTSGSEGAGSQVELSTNTVYNVHLAYGGTTTIKLVTEKNIDDITVGAPIVDLEFVNELKTIKVTPTVSAGATNMNVIIDGKIYVFILNITNDNRVVYSMTCTIPGERRSARKNLMANAPRMRPDEIDTVGLIKAIERARIDPVFRNAQKNMEQFPIGKVYQWNGQLIHLVDVHHFPSMDLLVVKIQWTNRGSRGLYLHANQYELWVANRQIPITARQQINHVLMPGQSDTCYLFIQGYRIEPEQNWELRLPPEAKQILRFVK